jgi:hypothetical protein
VAKRKINYRRIWIDYYGEIPKDDQGRSYEIHHIDGNRNNNSIENLTCISIEEHYAIHFNQGDYYACAAIKRRLELTEEDRKMLSEKVAEANRARPNPFNDPEIRQKCQETRKKNYKKENHQFYGKTRPDHSEFMKSIGFGKNKTKEHIEAHRKSWIQSTKDNPIRAKVWVIEKDGVFMEIKNLKKFCRDHNISFSRIYRGKEHNGYVLARDN